MREIAALLPETQRGEWGEAGPRAYRLLEWSRWRPQHPSRGPHRRARRLLLWRAAGDRQGQARPRRGEGRHHPRASSCTTRASRPTSPTAASGPPTWPTRSRAARSSSAPTAYRPRDGEAVAARPRSSRSSTPPAPGCSSRRRPPGSWPMPATRSASSATRTTPKSRACAPTPARTTSSSTTWTDPPGSACRTPRRSASCRSRRSCPTSSRSSPPSACADATTCASSTPSAR